jgi:hypothetical protein
MPRDLEPSKPAPVVQLTESPGKVPSSPDPDTTKPKDASPPEPQREFIIIPHDQQYKAPTNLHTHKGPSNLYPYTRPLTISDLESVVALENAAFSEPKERATREKVSFSALEDEGDRHVTNFHPRMLMLEHSLSTD